MRKSGGGVTLITKPHLWTANTEIDLGDGLYGYRAVGTITAAANADNYLPMHYHTAGKRAHVVSSGGYVYISSTQTACVGNNYLNGDIKTLLYDDPNAIYFVSKSSFARTNAPYDIWITFTEA